MGSISTPSHDIAGESPILIAGAGLVGLILAQHLKSLSIPFILFERDTSSTSRLHVGWGITIHWALPHLQALLPQHLLDRLPETFVNPEATARGEISSFSFFDFATGQEKWRVPPSNRIRISREKFRRLLLEGLEQEIRWGKTLKAISPYSFSSSTAINGVTLSFEDGTFHAGPLAICCDGANSRARQMLYPSPSRSSNYSLPIAMLGATVQWPAEFMTEVLKLDAYFFHGSSSENDSYMYFSILDAPTANRLAQEAQYTCQIMVSWPLRPGFFGRKEATLVPETAEGRLELMKTFASTWREPFRSFVHNIPGGTDVREIKLQDWPTDMKGKKEGLERCVIVGDAAHGMVMYRGEGANHAIADLPLLMEKLGPFLPASTRSHKTTANGLSNGNANGESASEALDPQVKSAIAEYEREVEERGMPAVLASRQACLDAHDFTRLNPQSPLFAKRIVKANLLKDAVNEGVSISST